MPKPSTDSNTVKQCLRIETKDIFKLYYDSKQKTMSAKTSWNNGNSILYEIEISEERQYIRLNYIISKNSGENIEIDYTINLASVPSNLGRGKIWYFTCPVSGKKTKTLFKTYGSHYFISRESYKKRIYYDCQICSKKYYDLERFFALDKLFWKLMDSSRKRYHKGNNTKLLNRLIKLKKKKEEHSMKSTYLFAHTYGIPIGKGRKLLNKAKKPQKQG